MENELDKCAVAEEGEAETAVPATERPKKKSLAWRILKWVLWSVAGLLAFVLVAALTLPLWISPIGTSLANVLVPKYTGTAFNVDRINLNPYTGKLLISGVKLANPEGYAEKDAFTLVSLSADVEVSTLLSDTIHVREITIDSPSASYVFDAEGVNNFDRIMEAVNEKLGPKKKKKKDTGETKVAIDKVTVKNVKVVVGNGRFELASLVLTDFGKDDKPAALVVSDVKLVNPPGFETENAFSLGSLSIGMETGDLGSLPIKIHDIVVDSPYASYVFDEQNVDNFTRMLEPLLATGGEPVPEKKEKKAEKKAESSGAPVTLDRLEVKNLVAQICKGRFELASLVVTDFGKPTAAMIKLEDAKLINPEGFPVPNAFSLKSISIGMETADLSKKPMVFHDIIVDTPYLGFSFDKDWNNNLMMIVRPLRDGKKAGDEKKGEKKKAKEEKSEEGGAQVVIEKLVLSNVKIGFSTQGTLPLGIPVPDVSLPSLSYTLNDIGKKSEKGARIKEVAVEVIDKVLGGLGDAGSFILDIGRRVVQGKDGNMLDLITSYAKKRFSGALKGITDTGGAVLDKSVEGVKKTGEKVGELKDKTAEGAKGIFNSVFGGDKKEEKKEEPEPGK